MFDAGTLEDSYIYIYFHIYFVACSSRKNEDEEHDN
jgi:hypothetical protein